MTPNHRPDDRVEMQQRLRSAGAIAILRLRRHEHAVQVATALAEHGITALEVTFDHKDAPRTLARIRSALPTDVLIGAGTIRSLADLTAAASAGAEFCVSPGVDTEIVRACLQAGVEPLPGACTATEIGTALDSGARLVKLFPAGPLGESYLRALRGPFPHTWLVPTGGIAHTDVGRWLRAGATAVGLGSDLVPAEPGPADLPAIAHRAQAVCEQVRASRDGTDG